MLPCSKDRLIFAGRIKPRLGILCGFETAGGIRVVSSEKQVIRDFRKLSVQADFCQQHDIRTVKIPDLSGSHHRERLGNQRVYQSGGVEGGKVLPVRGSSHAGDCFTCHSDKQSEEESLPRTKRFLTCLLVAAFKIK